MPSVTGSPFDDELRSASARVPLFRAPRQPCLRRRRLPIDSTCLRLKTFLSLSYSFLSLSVASPSIRASPFSLYHGRVSFPFPHARLAFSFSPRVYLSFSIAYPRVEKKSVPRFFRPLSFSHRPDGSAPAPSLIPPDFGESVFSVRDRFSRNGVIKPVVYG